MEVHQIHNLTSMNGNAPFSPTMSLMDPPSSSEFTTQSSNGHSSPPTGVSKEPTEPSTPSSSNTPPAQGKLPDTNNSTPSSSSSSFSLKDAESNGNIPSFLNSIHLQNAPQKDATPSSASSDVPLINGQQVLSVSSLEKSHKQLIPSDDPNKQSYVDITEYLNYPQTTAAKKLGIPTSTLSKRWKEAVVARKWPYRTVSKIDKEIMTLLHNIPQGPDSPPLPPEIEHSLALLLKRRQEELRTVIIRI